MSVSISYASGAASSQGNTKTLSKIFLWPSTLLMMHGPQSFGHGNNWQKEFWLSPHTSSFSHNERFSLVHASPCNPADWNYILDEHDASEHSTVIQKRSLHRSYTYSRNIFIRDAYRELIRRTSIINVGICQPRDRNIDLSFGVFDTEQCHTRISAVRTIWKPLPGNINDHTTSKLGLRLLWSMTEF